MAGGCKKVHQLIHCTSIQKKNKQWRDLSCDSFLSTHSSVSKVCQHSRIQPINHGVQRFPFRLQDRPLPHQRGAFDFTHLVASLILYDPVISDYQPSCHLDMVLAFASPNLSQPSYCFARSGRLSGVSCFHADHSLAYVWEVGNWCYMMLNNFNFSNVIIDVHL